MTHSTTVDAIRSVNPAVANTDLIYPGQILQMPCLPAVATASSCLKYTVVEGDGLWAIGQKYGVSVEQLLAMNWIENADLIYVGQVLNIPCRAASSTQIPTDSNIVNYGTPSGSTNFVQAMTTTSQSSSQSTDYYGCWIKSYGRGVGTIPDSCSAGQTKNGLLCYPNCQPGYNAVGPVCWGSCPSGWNTVAGVCWNPIHCNPIQHSYASGTCPGFDLAGLWHDCKHCPDG